MRSVNFLVGRGQPKAMCVEQARNLRLIGYSLRWLRSMCLGRRRRRPAGRETTAAGAADSGSGRSARLGPLDWKTRKA